MENLNLLVCQFLRQKKRSKSAKFQLCTMARGIIIFMPNALLYLCFVFAFFPNPEVEIMLNMVFNTLLTICKNEEEEKKEQHMDLYNDIRNNHSSSS